ncbi:MAG: glycosyltransferase family 1 protein [Bryobacterales bacterium]|nr:glycosyltransferase family 1 protein [Bryobacterales bacterium]
MALGPGRSAKAIGIDAGNCFDRPPTGVAVYARNLTTELARSHPNQSFVWHLRSNRYLRSFRARLPSNVTRRLGERFPGHPAVGPVALFHGLNQRLPEAADAPMVATFHDLFAMTGDYSTPGFRERFAKLAVETARRANHIIAISEHTARLVEGLLGFPRANVTVVHHGVEALDAPAPAEERSILEAIDVTPPFVLHMGTIQARKNVGRLVEAFEAAGSGRQLVLAGSTGYGGPDILSRIERSAARSRIRLPGHVGDKVRSCLYRSAECLLFPSLDEGFGLPVVEAMASGLPVITSDTSALPEVAGDAGLLVDPLSVDAIADGLARVLASPDLRAELAAKGLMRATAFTWRRCADQTWNAYQRLLAG